MNLPANPTLADPLHGDAFTTEQRLDAAGGVAPLGGNFVKQYENAADIRIIARNSGEAKGICQQPSETGETHTPRKLHRKALDVRPAVVAFCADGRSSIPAYLSTAEAAAILGVTVGSIHKLVHFRRLQALARGAFRVAAASVLNYREGRA